MHIVSIGERFGFRVSKDVKLMFTREPQEVPKQYESRVRPYIGKYLTEVAADYAEQAQARMQAKLASRQEAKATKAKTK